MKKRYWIVKSVGGVLWYYSAVPLKVPTGRVTKRISRSGKKIEENEYNYTDWILGPTGAKAYAKRSDAESKLFWLVAKDPSLLSLLSVRKVPARVVKSVGSKRVLDYIMKNAGRWPNSGDRKPEQS